MTTRTSGWGGVHGLVRGASALLLACAWLPGLSGQSPTYSPPTATPENVTWSRDGTTFTVTYDLVASDPDAVFEVRLEVLMNGVPFTPVAVSGDVGSDVRPGPGKKISWQSSKDTDNQDFESWRFVVRPVSGKPQVSTEDSTTPTSPPTGPVEPPAPASLIGAWRGLYAGSRPGDFPAQLTVERQNGSAFAGVMHVVTEPGEPATQLEIQGEVTAVGVVIFREISILDTGAEGRWNLGSASGRMATEGARMGGTGTDRRTEYQWFLEKITAEPLDLGGRWEGEYAGAAAQLIVDRIDGSTLAGRLLVTTRRGRESTELAVEGTIMDRMVQLREVRVVRLGAASEWNLGTSTGTLGAGGLQMFGRGRDEAGKEYEWFLLRRPQ